MNTEKIVYNKENSEGIMSFITNIKDDFKIIAKRNREIDGRMNCGAGWDISIKSCNKAYHTQFNNARVNGGKAPEAEAIIDCIISDATAYLSSQDFYDFCREFGYDPEPTSKTRSIYNACKKAYDRLSLMFTDDELYSIQDKLWNY